MERARRLCLDLLDRRPRTRVELARALEQRGIPASAATSVLDRLTEVGLVDDAAFAQAWVETRHASRGLGRAALQRELRRRGVAEEVLRSATETVDADAELAAAQGLVAARLSRLGGLPRAAAVRRLTGLLARRGYPPGLAARVVDEALGAGEGGGSTFP
ncbi:MAG: regulatory protein RecX [Mycobacteriales bacterium]